MISRKFFRKIIIHPTLIIFFIIAFITGTFIQFATIITIVFIHELGHYFAARFFKWRIDSVVLWAFGGVMITDEHDSRPLIEELIVTIAGPLQHIVIFFFIQFFSYFDLLSPYIIEQAIFFNRIILLFNLLPIYPLDGGKICKVFFSYFLPYRRCFQLVLIFSFIVCIFILVVQLIVLPFTFSAMFIVLFLIIEIYKNWKNEYFTFIRYLLHRLSSEQQSKKVRHLYVSDHVRLMEIFNQFKRNTYYYIYITPQYYVTETDSLKRYFYDKKHTETIKEIYLK